MWVSGGRQRWRLLEFSSNSGSSVEIPTFLESVEALEFLGFTWDVAKDIFEIFLSHNGKRIREICEPNTMVVQEVAPVLPESLPYVIND